MQEAIVIQRAWRKYKARKYFQVSIKTHQQNNDIIIIIKYILDDFKANEYMLRHLTDYYISLISQHNQKVIVVFDLRDVENYDKESIWRGAAHLKNKEDIIQKYIKQAFVLTENEIVNTFLNILIRVNRSQIDTKFCKNT